jgi:hypothetical protein
MKVLFFLISFLFLFFTIEGGVELVNTAMQLHRADELLQIAGATFLGLLCKIASLRNHIVSTNACPLLLSAMRTFRTDIEYIRAALKTIYRMAFSTSAREQFATNPNLVERIFEAIQVSRIHFSLFV